MDVRHKFTDALKAHGATDNRDYGMITNDIYRALFDTDKNGCLIARGLSHKDNLRDNLSSTELAAVMLVESCTEQALEECAVQGTKMMREVTKATAEAVRRSIEQAKQFIRDNQPKKIAE